MRAAYKMNDVLEAEAAPVELARQLAKCLP